MKRPRDWALTSYGLMIGAWIFDFRAEESGSGLAIQAAFLGLFLVGFVCFLAFDRGGKAKIRGMMPFQASIAILLGVSVVCGLLRDQVAYLMLRQALTLMIYGIMTFATARLFEQVDMRKLRVMLATLCALFVVAQPLIVMFFQGGINLATVRFQIISGACSAAEGYLVILLMSGLLTMEKVAMALDFAVIFISITRSQLVIAVLMVAPVWRTLQRALSPRVVLFGFFALMLLVGFASATSEGLERWQHRLFEETDSSGENVTYYTRASESDFMWTHVIQGVDTFLLGNGLAAETEYWNPKSVGGGREYDIGFGHNQHLSMLFVAGFMGGGPILLMQFIQFFAAIQMLYKMSARKQPWSDAMLLGAWGAASVIGYVVGGFLAPTFAGRGAAIWYGVGTGLMLGAKAQLDPRNAAVFGMQGLPLAVRSMASDLGRAGLQARDRAAVNLRSLPAAVRRRRDHLRRLSETLGEG